MNRRITMGIIATILGVTMGNNILANTVQREEESTSIPVVCTKEELSHFVVETGEVCTITNGENGYELQVGNIQEGTIFYLSEDIMIFDVARKEFVQKQDIEEGMSVSIIYSKDAPMMLSLPARCSDAKLVIIQSATENVQVGYFNEELIDENNTLALNIEEDTIIKDSLQKNNVLSTEDIKNKDLMVVYTNTTRSIPAQTTPSFILVIEDEDNKGNKVDAEMDENEIVALEDIYVEMCVLAQENGFKVAWDNKEKTVILNKGNEQLRFTVGEMYYIHNEEKKALNYPIKLENNRVMIVNEVFR